MPEKRITTNLAVLVPDVAAAFPNDSSLNEALHLVALRSKVLRM
jgi:hypothetical protein